MPDAPLTREQLLAAFPLGPDSLPQAGVPCGRVEKYSFAQSRAFPGTVRDYYVYVPVQYDPARPACVIVFQDGQTRLDPAIRWQVPVTLDNLIAKGDIPVCIGILIDPGKVPATDPATKPRLNRSFEYDSVGDRYARLVLDEIIPEVARLYNLAPDGGSRMIMGGSSGGVSSFIAAWERPDGFRRVFSDVGSFTALRGGNMLPALVRLTEPKPIRVFVQSGARDLVVYAGSWWTANLDMLAALEYAGYEVGHCWHEDAGHDDGHGPAIFPDAIRWLWKDYPAPIQAGVNSRQPVMRILIPGEGWQPAGAATGALAAGPGGEILFASETARSIGRIGADGRVSEVAGGVDGVTDLSAGADGCVEACQPALGRIASFDAAGRMTVAVPGIAAWSQCAAPGGGRYVADPSGGAVWLVGADGGRRVVAREVPEPRCVRLTHDRSGLIVTDGRGRTARLFAVRPGGTLDAGSPFFLLHLPGESAECGAAQVAPFNEAWTCFATTLGLQVATAYGSTCAIIPPPGPGPVTGVAFGGPDRCDLHVACGGRLYRRRIRPAADVWC